MQFDTSLNCLRAEIDGEIIGDPSWGAEEFFTALQGLCPDLPAADVSVISEECGRWRGALSATPARDGSEGITKNEFVARFPLFTEAAIRDAAKTDPVIAVLLARIDMWEGPVHTDAPIIVDGLAYLRNKNPPLLTAEEHAIIGAP